MKVQQFKFKQNSGVATAFIAESDEEQAVLDVLQSMIVGEQGVLSRKCFSFEDGTMTMALDKVKPKSPYAHSCRSNASSYSSNASTTKKNGATSKADKK